MTYLTGWSRISVIAFYLTYANLLGLLFDATNLFSALFLYAVISLACAFMQKIKIVCVLPLILLFLIPVIIPVSLVNILILIPPTAYLIYDVIARLMNIQPSIDYPFMFKLFVIIFLPLVLMLSPVGSGYLVRTMMIPFGFTFFLSTVTLLRATRHQEEVLESKIFHFLNFLTPLLLLCGGFLLSTNFVGNILSFILQSLLQYLFRPILMVFFWIISWIFFLLVYLFRIGIGGSSGEMDIPALPGMMMFEEASDYYREATTIPWFIRSLLIIILVAVCVFVLFLIFRSMSYRINSLALEDNEHVTRRRLDDNHIFTRKRRKSTGNKIRDIYYDYIRFCKKQGISIKPYMTSEDIFLAATEYANEDPHRNLRMLYIKSRYGEYEYSKKDVQQAKQMYQQIQKDIKKDPSN